MQEIVSRMTNASIQEPELFAKLYELKPNDGNDYAEHITFVLGGAGTGKTTVVVATVLDMVRQSNNSSKI
jgi:Cdc6-like AAA superfamily ATPase